MTLPLVVLFALVIGNITGDAGSPSSSKSPSALPAITLPAPPDATAHAAQCTKVIEKLPVTLDGLAPRVVHPHPDSPYVLAWGNPAVIFRCGVARPADLKAGSSAQYITAGPVSGPFYDVTTSHGNQVLTTVDRTPYLSIEIPSKYSVANVAPPLSDAIAAALPPVCTTDPATVDLSKLCTRRP